jgi:hypothetical protein
MNNQEDGAWKSQGAQDCSGFFKMASKLASGAMRPSLGSLPEQPSSATKQYEIPEKILTIP